MKKQLTGIAIAATVVIITGFGALAFLSMVPMPPGTDTETGTGTAYLTTTEANEFILGAWTEGNYYTNVQGSTWLEPVTNFYDGSWLHALQLDQATRFTGNDEIAELGFVTGSILIIKNADAITYLSHRSVDGLVAFAPVSYGGAIFSGDASNFDLDAALDSGLFNNVIII